MAPFTNIQAIAFDLDGTLIDSAPGLANAIDAALADLQLPMPGLERVTCWIGNGADIMTSRALRWALGDTPSDELLIQGRTLFDHHYMQTAETGSQLFPEVKATLEQLQEAGVPMAIVTNKPTPFVRPLLDAFQISDYFRLVIGGDDVPVKKPHPAALFMVLGQFGLLPAELLFVGDSRNDIQAGKASGVQTLGLTYGYNYGESIASSNPDRLASQFDQLLPLVGR